MEQIEGLAAFEKANWLNRRCRSIVHSVFEKLTFVKCE